MSFINIKSNCSWQISTHRRSTSTVPNMFSTMPQTCPRNIPQIPNLLLDEVQRLPSWLEDLLMRLLAKNPDARPANADEVIDVLEQGRSGTMTRERRTLNVPRLPVDPDPVKERLWAPGIGISVLFGLGAGLIWGFLQ